MWWGWNEALILPRKALGVGGPCHLQSLPWHRTARVKLATSLEAVEAGFTLTMLRKGLGAGRSDIIMSPPLLLGWCGVCLWLAWPLSLFPPLVVYIKSISRLEAP